MVEYMQGDQSSNTVKENLNLELLRLDGIMLSTCD